MVTITRIKDTSTSQFKEMRGKTCAVWQKLDCPNPNSHLIQFEHSGCLAVHEKIKTPVIALHETALGVLELAFLDECEPQFPTEGVRWWIVYGWEGVQKPIRAVGLDDDNSLGNRPAEVTRLPSSIQHTSLCTLVCENSSVSRLVLLRR